MMMDEKIVVYTDGSCHTQLLTGAWAAIIIEGGKRTVVKGVEEQTTHNRMEILSVLKAIAFIDANGAGEKSIEVFSDSQYVVNLLSRKEKLIQKNFITNAGNPVQNSDLVKEFFSEMDKYRIRFFKVKAHQKDGDVLNREVDLLVRQLLRDTIISKNGTKI